MLKTEQLNCRTHNDSVSIALQLRGTQKEGDCVNFQSSVLAEKFAVCYNPSPRVLVRGDAEEKLFV